MKELELTLELLEKKNINIMDLDILSEIKWQAQYYLEIELSEEEKNMIFEQVQRAYLKSEGIPIHVITTAAMDNLDKLKDMSTYDLVEESCWRY